MRIQKEMSPLKRKILQKKSDVISYIYFLRKIKRYGLKRAYNLIKENKKNQVYSRSIGVVSIIKNEGPYIQEWIEFHKMVGVDVFYIYDNGSTDETKKILTPYINSGLVKYHLVEGEGQQITVYNQAIADYRYSVKWMAILDADEFLVPVKNSNILEFLTSIEGNYSQVLVGWLIYGSNGYKVKPEGLVTENYKKHANSFFLADYKPIINPRLAMQMNFPHWVDVIGKTIDENGTRIWGYPFITKSYSTPSSKKKIRINHYYSKSLEEFIAKSKRGYADYAGTDRAQRDMDAFKEHDQNIAVDGVMDKFVEKLHQSMK